MKINKPKDDARYSWTNHVVDKMNQYQLSPQMVKRVIRSPRRVEAGVAPRTTAVMQTRGNKRKTEIWVMYTPAKRESSKFKAQNSKLGKIKIISAWRYPGVSPVRGAIPIPPDIMEELEKIT